MLLSFLERSLGYRRGDGFTLFFFVIQGVLIQAGVAVGISASDALFINRLGSQALPVLYIIMPAAMIVFIPLLTVSMNRLPILRFMEGIHILLAILGAAAYFLSSGESKPDIVYYALKLHTYVWMVSLYSVYWNHVDHYYTAIEARRLYPLLSAALSAGAMLGGFIASAFAESAGVFSLYLVWGGLAAAAFVLQKTLGGRLQLVYFRENEGELKTGVNSIISYALGTPYGFMMTMAMMLLIFMTTFAEYFYLDIFSGQISDANTLASFLGSLFFAANFINFAINLFLYKLLLRTPGLLAIIPLQPFLYFATFMWLYLDYGMNPAVFAFVVYQGIQLSVDLNNWNFIYNPVPEKLKHGLRIFIEGISDPAGTALAGLALLLISTAESRDGAVLFAFFSTIPAIAFTVGIRQRYAIEMIAKLRKTWIDLSSGDFSLLKRRARLDEKSAGGVAGDISERGILTVSDKKRVVNTIQNIHDEALIQFLSRFLQEHDPSAAFKSVRTGILNAPREIQKIYRPALRSIINTAGAGLMVRIIAWAKRDVNRLSWQINEELALQGLISPERCEKWLTKNKLDFLSVALAGLLKRGRDPTIMEKVWKKFNTVYRSGEKSRVLWLAGELGRIDGKSEFMDLLLKELDSRDPAMRKTALHSLLHLADENSHGLAEIIFAHMLKSKGSERELCMEILVLTKDSAILDSLMRGIQNFSPSIQRKAYLFMRRAGLKTVPSLTRIIPTNDYSPEARGISARALGILSPAHLESIYEGVARREIPYIFRLMYDSEVLRNSGMDSVGVGLWIRHLEDLFLRSLRFLLQLLSSTGRIAGAAQVEAALRSDDPRARAYALESLQAALPASLYREIVPFVERSSVKEKMEYFQRRYANEKSGAKSSMILEMSEKERLTALWSETDAPGIPDENFSRFVLESPLFRHLPVKTSLEYRDHFKMFKNIKPGEFASGTIPDRVPVLRSGTARQGDMHFNQGTLPPCIGEALLEEPLSDDVKFSKPSGYYISAETLREIGLRHADFFLHVGYIRNRTGAKA